MSERVNPNDGGCWFCQRKTADMEFTQEFDAWYHIDCLIDTLRDVETDHVEARIIAAEWIGDERL